MSRSRLLSIGIGLNGAESHTYAVPVLTKEAFYKLPLAERFFEHGGYWRKVVVRVLTPTSYKQGFPIGEMVKVKRPERFERI